MSRRESRNRRISSFALKGLGIVFVLVGSFFPVNQQALGQEERSRPVARLITPDSSRPPRRTEGLLSSSTTKTLPSFADATPIERKVFAITNSIRLTNGLAAFSWDPALCLMARTHSEKMARLEFFSHETPEGSRLKERARAVGIIHFRVIAENIAYNQGSEDPGAFAVERWMNSSGHRENILSIEFQSSAIGVFVTSEGAVYLTQIFISR